MMFTHPELMLLQATERRLELETEARQRRLTLVLREARRAHHRRARANAEPGREPSHQAGRRTNGREATLRGHPAGTLAACAANGVPAR